MEIWSYNPGGVVATCCVQPARGQQVHHCWCVLFALRNKHEAVRSGASLEASPLAGVHYCLMAGAAASGKAATELDTAHRASALKPLECVNYDLTH